MATEVQIRSTVGPQAAGNGGSVVLRGDVLGGIHVSPLLPTYYELVRSGQVFGSLAQTITAPVIWSTAAGQGAIIYNPSGNTKNVALLAVGIGIVVASTVAGSLGVAQGLTSAPTSTTPADARWNALTSGAASSATPYRIGTPSGAATGFMPLREINTAALTVSTGGIQWVPVEGLMVVGPGGFLCVAGSATLTTLQVHIGLLWAELPI